MFRLLTVVACVALLSPAVCLRAETPPEQEEAIKALRGWPSNLQKNRDGTVRFIRFSKAGVTDEHLAHVAAFRQLDYLAVVTPSVTDEGLKHVAGLTNLDTLFLSDSSLTDAAMPALQELSKLERLYLDRTKVTDSGLASIAGLNALTTLSLVGTSITNEGLAHVSKLENLEVLFLSETGVTDEGLKSLAKLSRLKTLYLDETAVSVAGFETLGQLPSLEVLSLRGATLETGSLVKLSGCQKLNRLLLYETEVTAEDVAPLRGKLKKLMVKLGPSPAESRNAFQRLLAGEKLRAPDSRDASLKPEAVNDQISTVTASVAVDIGQRLANANETPDFQKHVLPLLGRLGCNGRTCHGSFQGKGGFTLSMFGYDFDADHKALTGGDEPRVDLKEADESLIIYKPTHEDDHGGGQRFKVDSWEHRLLRRWIESGAKGLVDGPQRIVQFDVTPAEIVFAKAGETKQLKCVAIWDDGTREDVTPLTRFQSNDDVIAEVTADGLITCKSPGDTYVISFYDNGIFSTQVMLPVSDRTGDRFPEVATPTEIDRLVTRKLARLGVVPSELSSDEDFLRRVSLDMIGTLPTPDEQAAFLADPSPDKRQRRIDELLESPAYADWWAVRFCDLTGSNSQYLGTTDMNTPASIQWNEWMRRRIQDNVGWDKIAAGIVLSESRRPGQTYEEYAAEQSLFLRSQKPEDFTAHDNPMHYYWFRSNNQIPTDRALSFGYVFLGVRLQCAQCHKHPFDQWSKQDFEKFTQFFTRVKAGVAPDAAEAQAQLKTKLGVPVKLDTAALRRQMYLRVSAEGLPIPWNEIWIEEPGDKPQIAKLLGNEELDLNGYVDPREPLMAWLLQEDNPYFARAFVNRIWHHYFGVGIVEPPDDFNMANPPSNKPLLDWLSQQFVANGYDMKWLHRTIANSRTYQLSWKPNETNRDDLRNFSHAQIRRMPAEVTIDAILQATANDARLKTWSSNTSQRKITQHPKSIQARGIDYSLLVFGKPLRTTNCDCERQGQPTLLQSLYVRNDTEMLEWLERSDGWLVETAKRLGQPLTLETKAVKPDSTATPAKEKPPTPDDPVIDELVTQVYQRTVSRRPSGDEIARGRAHLKSGESTIESLRDLMWALLNTQEFLTNH
ncbi:MAG: DUF1553 domain-containing protein [Planctomycetota bacterium]|nr:DUF1553 domain-containing protein [Planctomycetota bacterium]